MPIYTPRGLKIRFEPEFAFSLLARLSPRIPPFRVLKTTEGIEEAPSAVALIAGLLCLLRGVAPITLAAVVFGAFLAVRCLMLYGVFIVPGIVSIGTIYSYLAGFGVLLLAVLVIGFTFSGWESVLAYFVGLYGAGLVGYAVEWWEMKRVFRLGGVAITSSERNFVNAYRLHASRIGVTIDVDVSEAEMKEGEWRNTLHAFAAAYPEVVRRFIG